MSRAPAWIGLDIGTSRVKAVAWSERGEWGSAAAATPWQGGVLDAEALSRVAISVCEQSLDDIPEAVDVVAVGVASMGEAGIWVDYTGPVGPLTGWQDQSDTEAFYRRFINEWDPMTVYQRTGVAASPKFGLFRTMVGSRPRPLKESTWLQAADWIVYRWTGGSRVTHANLAARTMALDWQRQTWDDAILQFAGLSAVNLPQILTRPVNGGVVRSDLSDRMKGAAMVPAGQDHAAAYVGAGLPGGVALDSSGTAEPWVVEEDQPILTPTAFQHGIIWAPNVLGTGFAGLLPTPAGGAAERWAQEWFGGPFSQRPGTSSVQFEAEGFMRGQARLVGLGPSTDASMIYEAVLVGVAQSIENKLQALRQIAGREFSEVAWVGGAVAHRRWEAIRQEQISAHLWALEPPEAAALGALLAAMAATTSPEVPRPPRTWRKVASDRIENPPWSAVRG
ncbi:MAG: FGGY family carbohydrate kinase [Firmicutes bacterium]|nr:FGGY family carbohydrate kinase [Bacillota bacterium]